MGEILFVTEKTNYFAKLLNCLVRNRWINNFQRREAMDYVSRPEKMICLRKRMYAISLHRHDVCLWRK